MRKAQCSCGQLSIECEGEPNFVAMCHCKLCQIRTSTVFAVNAGFMTTDVRTHGESRTYSRRGDSGRLVTFHFCPECGGSVYWSGEMRPDMTVVGAGSFTDPDFKSPQRAVWAENRHGWVAVPEGIPVYPKGAGHSAAKPQ